MAAVFPTAAGTPTFSAGYNPVIYSKKLLVKLYKGTCLREICNTDWEGEVKEQGDKVIIRTRPTININTHVKGQKLVIQQPNTTTVEMDLDKGLSYSFAVNPIDVVQSDLPFAEHWEADALEQMKIEIERGIFEAVPVFAAAANQGVAAGAINPIYNLGSAAAPLGLTTSNVVQWMTSLAAVMGDQNVPMDNRWVIVPNWVWYIMMNSDLKNAMITGDQTSPLRNGKVGSIAGMRIYNSNNLYHTQENSQESFYVMAGHPMALTFATQLIHNEVVDNTEGFGKIHKGLNVYGYKVVKPEALVTSHVYAA